VAKISATAMTANENILFSNFRCMKNRKTKDDFTAAIISASITVKVPRYICVMATEVNVRMINSARI
jgi:hypothetical protein